MRGVYSTASEETQNGESSNSNQQKIDDNQSDAFIQEALKAHNEFRSLHEAPALTHNSELSKIAQEYAQKLTELGKMVHSGNKYNEQRLGENLAYFYSTRMENFAGDKATSLWYNEIKDHDYEAEFQLPSGHFSQVVWKSTREVGFGVAKAANGAFYAVANYFPAGNILGKFQENVSKPIS